MDNPNASESFASFTHFAGFDWARAAAHQIVVVDPSGRIVLHRQVEQTSESWAALRQALRPLGKVAVAIETNNGPAVERLLEMGLSVYPMNPKAAERYRDRKAPSGVKDDFRDGWSFADALRTDGHAWRVLRGDDPRTCELRMLCRDEIGLIEQRTALVNQLQAALYEYFPAALEAFDDWTMAAPWEFIVQFPTPAALAAASKRRWQSFFHTHRLYQKQMAERRMEIFARAQESASPSAAVIAAKSMLAVSLAKTLRTLEQQIKEYRQRIDKLFGEHPDHDLFGSLPGAGAKLAPRLLGEIGSNRQTLDSPDALRCLAGTAPVTKQSGTTRFVFIRWMCNKVLRATVHLWADESRHQCVWAEVYYQKKRQEGKSHAQALRCLGQRWLKILWKMWQEHRCYDQALHTASQVKHGSWVLGLMPQVQP